MECDRMDFTIFPPKDGQDGDNDDALSDDDGIRALEKGVLKQPMEITTQIMLAKNQKFILKSGIPTLSVKNAADFEALISSGEEDDDWLKDLKSIPLSFVRTNALIKCLTKGQQEKKHMSRSTHNN